MMHASPSALGTPGHVSLLTLERSASALSLTVRLVPADGSPCLCVRFLGVRELRFRGETTELLELVRLGVEDVSRRGWEGVHFQVKDLEEEFISFFCSEIVSLGDSSSS